MARSLIWLALGLITYFTDSRSHARLADPLTFDQQFSIETATPRD